MEVKKAIKKIVALGTGLAMVGATIFGAAAANLSEYPSPMFIEDGSFNGVIVVGDSAAASDVIGSVDIATSLQYSSTVVAEVSSGAAVNPTINNGVRIEKSGNDLNFGESIADIQSTSLDNSDLPVVLMDGEFEDTEGQTDNSESYTQELSFYDGTAELIFDQDDDDAPDAGDYLKIDKNEKLYTYTLEFDDSVEYTITSTDTPAEDLETTTLDIQGQTYTIVDVEYDSTYMIDKITLQAGETTSWLEEGVEITKAISGVTHTVVLDNVNENEDKCGLSVDGTSAWVEVGQTKTINGVSIGVTDAIVVHSAGKDTDVCEVNLGAEEIVLETGQEVEINSADVDGSEVTILGVAGSWDGITISYDPDEEMWLAAGDEWVDPVFGNFMIKYSGLTKVTEDIEVDVSGEDAELSFVSIDGEDIEIPVYCEDECDETDDAIYLGTGEDIDERYYISGDICQSTLTIPDVTDCEGMRIIINAGGEAHIVEVDNIDTNNGKVIMKDVTYGGSTKESDYVTGVTKEFALPSGAGTVELTIGAGSVAVTSATGSAYFAGGLLETELGADITLTIDGVTLFPVITITETGDEDGDDPEISGDIVISFSVDVADKELNIDLETPIGTFSVDESEDNDGTTMITTPYGTLIKYDSEEDRSVKISYAEEEVYGNVFVAPVDAMVTSGGTSGTVSTTVIQKIQVGAAKLASEVANIKEVNAIIIGGPCANSAAATLMGNPEKCWESVPENKAIIKLYENNGNVALLVAGRSALDTRRASRVLANADDYDLSGMEVEVTGTSLTDISVSAPQ